MLSLTSTIRPVQYRVTVWISTCAPNRRGFRSAGFADFTDADFTDADFTDADFTDADFTDADFDRTGFFDIDVLLHNC